jgi:hypothetical protein
MEKSEESAEEASWSMTDIGSTSKWLSRAGRFLPAGVLQLNKFPIRPSMETIVSAIVLIEVHGIVEFSRRLVAIHRERAPVKIGRAIDRFYKHFIETIMANGGDIIYMTGCRQ